MPPKQSLFSMVELLLQRIKQQEPELADWTNATEKFGLLSSPGILMAGLKGFVEPHLKLLQTTRLQLGHFETWENNWEDLTTLLKTNFDATGISTMITVDWDKFKNEEEHRQQRFETISVLLGRILLGVEWLPLWNE